MSEGQFLLTILDPVVHGKAGKSLFFFHPPCPDATLATNCFLLRSEWGYLTAVIGGEEE